MTEGDVADLVTLGDLADELNLRRSAVTNWADRYLNFPKPVAHIGRSRVYSRRQVLAWRESGLRVTPKRFTSTLWLRLSPESRRKVEDLMRELAVREGLLDPEEEEET
jgi:hypothetical protein